MLVILFVWVKVFISWWSAIADNIIDIKNIVSLAWDVNSLQDRQCCFDWFHSKQETEFLDYLDAQEVITLNEGVWCISSLNFYDAILQCTFLKDKQSFFCKLGFTAEGTA